MPAPAQQIDDILYHMPILKLVSRIKGPTHRFQMFYGTYPGGPLTTTVPKDRFSWDIFDKTRKVAQGRARAAGPASIQAQPIGNVRVQLYRTFESMRLEQDRLYKNRPLGGPFGAVDDTGRAYVMKQSGHMMERIMNNREALMMWMFKGGFQLKPDGDNLVMGPSSGSYPISIDYQHPATNQGTVEGVFAGDWQAHATANVIQELLNLNEHAARNARFPQQVAWLRATAANHVLQNQEVKDLGGTANVVTADNGMLRFSERNVDGDLSNVMSFVLRGFPTMQWIIYDDFLELQDGTTVDYIDDGEVIFTPLPSDDWLTYGEGTELVQERVGGGVREVQGTALYRDVVRHPLAQLLFGLDNGLALPYVPSAWYRATVHA